MKHSLKGFCKISAKVLQLTFNFLDGIEFLVVALLKSIFWMFFSTWNFDTGWNEKASDFPSYFWMIGWNLYLQIAFTTGPKRLTELCFIIFSFIFKFETVFLKKVFNLSVIFWSSYNNSWYPLFKKKGLRVFQKSLLSSQMMNLDYCKKKFSLFYTADYKVFFAFRGLLMIFVSSFQSRLFPDRIFSLLFFAKI